MYLIPFKSDHAKIMMSQGTNAAQIGMNADHYEVFNNLEHESRDRSKVATGSTTSRFKMISNFWSVFICSGLLFR